MGRKPQKRLSIGRTSFHKSKKEAIVFAKKTGGRVKKGRHTIRGKGYIVTG